MKSIFHVAASTPEDLRRELLSWLASEANRELEDFRRHKRPTNITIAAANSAIQTLKRVEAFWAAVNIDPRTPKPKPTIQELEAILAQPNSDKRKITINPDGSISCTEEPNQ